MWPIKSCAVGKQDYNQKNKYTDENKRIYHRGLVFYINDRQAYKAERGDESPTRVLSLESTGMVSMKLMVNDCGIPLEHVDVVSRNARFAPTNKSVKTGVLYFGELYDYLLKAARRRREIRRDHL